MPQDPSSCIYFTFEEIMTDLILASAPFPCLFSFGTLLCGKETTNIYLFTCGQVQDIGAC